MSRKIASYVLAVGLGAVLFSATQAWSGEDKKSQMSMEEMMKQCELMGQPGPEHQELMEAAGTWSTETKMWMGPGEPTVSTGTSKMEPILGGRFIRESYKCTFNDKPFEGMGINGYDNNTKKYVSIWLDNMGTGILRLEGTKDDGADTITYHGSYVDPMFGPTKMRNVLKEVSDDKCIFTMYTTGPDGNEQKSMEITYTRQ